MLIGATSTLFLVSRGLPLQQVIALKGTQAMVILALDVPLSYLADRVGRKVAVCVAGTSGVLWLAMTAYSPDLWWLYVAEAFNAVSFALFNGAYDAILIDRWLTVHPDGRVVDCLTAFTTVSFTVMAVAAGIGGLFGPPDSPAVWWIAASTLTAVTGYAVVGLPSDRASRATVRRGLASDVRTLRAVGRRGGAALGLVVVASVAGQFAYQLLIQFWQPLFTTDLEDRQTGVILSGVFVLILLAQSRAGCLTRRQGAIRTTTICAALFVCFALLQRDEGSGGITTAVALIGAFAALRALLNLCDGELNEMFEGELRATSLSVVSTMVRVSIVVCAPALAPLHTAHGTGVVAWVCLASSLLSGGALALRAMRVAGGGGG